MIAWAKRIKVRDRVCQMCGKGPGYDHGLESAHIFGKQAHPALKYVDENGLLLGQSCHRKFDGDRQAAYRWVDMKWPGRIEELRAIERERSKVTACLVRAGAGM